MVNQKHRIARTFEEVDREVPFVYNYNYNMHSATFCGRRQIDRCQLQALFFVFVFTERFIEISNK